MAQDLLETCDTPRGRAIATVQPNPRAAAATAAPAPGRARPSLRYVNTHEPGLSRRRCGNGFAYFEPGGEPLRDRETKQRLNALAVPPAWSDVWLCTDPKGHIQATGRDERGRKQYVYHPEWREIREASKFAHLGSFARVLAIIRRRIEVDLASSAPREAAVLAAAAQLLDLTGIRVGNRSYFTENGTVGLTTLQDRHARIDGDRIGLRFTAKSGRDVRIKVSDKRLAKILLRCEELRGQRLFRYVEGDAVKDVDSARFNEYLREVSGADISAKDFRTWIATVTVVEAWLTQSDGPLKIKQAASVAAKRLANTPAVTRRSYIHPGILDIVTSRGPAPLELRVGRRNGARLSGPERLCARLLEGS